MIKNHLLKFVCICFVLLSLVGCVGSIRKIDTLPNTFVFQGSNLFEGIRAVSISHVKEKDCFWYIRSIQHIPAHNFHITAGQIPEGFVLGEHSTHEKLILTPGKQYRIWILTSNPDRCPVQLAWIAE